MELLHAYSMHMFLLGCWTVFGFRHLAAVADKATGTNLLAQFVVLQLTLYILPEKKEAWLSVVTGQLLALVLLSKLT